MMQISKKLGQEATNGGEEPAEVTAVGMGVLAPSPRVTWMLEARPSVPSTSLSCGVVRQNGGQSG